MKNILMRIAYAAAAIALSVGCIAALRPDLFGLKDNTPHEEATAAAAPVTDPIAQFRQEREQLRSLQLSELDDMINSESTSPEMARMAEEEKLDVLRRYEIEETIAGILRAQGFVGAATCAEDDCVSVLIYADEPTQAQVAAITELVVAHTGVDAANIKIIPIN